MSRQSRQRGQLSARRDAARTAPRPDVAPSRTQPSAESTPIDAWRRHGAAVILLFAAALLVRLIFLLQASGTPYFELLNIDTKSYQEWAREILDKGWMPTRVFYQSALYSYVLAVLYAVFGQSLWVPRLAQILLGSLSVVLLYGIGTLLSSRRVGLIAAILLCFYGPLILEEIMLVKTSVIVFGSLLSLLLLLRYAPIARKAGVFASGFAMGVTAVGAGQWLVALPFLALCAALSPVAASSRQRIALALVFGAGSVVAIAPVAAWNTHSGGGFLLTSADAGLNLYLGNNPRATGLPARPEGLRDIPEYEEADAKRIAEQDAGRPLSAAQVSRYWTRRALSYITGEPGEFAVRLVRKLVVLWNSYEISDDYHYSFMRSQFLPWLEACVTFTLVGPLALMAMLVLLPRWRSLLPLYLACLSYLGILVLFYVRGRYRLAVVPFLIVFAAAGIDWLLQRLRRRQWESAALGGVLLLGSALFVTHDYCEAPHHGWPEVCLSGDLWFDQEYLKLGYWFQGKGGAQNEDRALWYMNRALDFPGNEKRTGKIYFSIGSLELTRGKRDMAAGRVDEGTKRLRAAEAGFEKAIELEFRVAASYVNLGSVYRSMSAWSQAVAALEHAIRLTPKDTTALFNLGRVYVQVGRCADARRVLQQAGEIEPRYAASAARLIAQCRPAG